MVCVALRARAHTSANQASMLTKKNAKIAFSAGRRSLRILYKKKHLKTQKQAKSMAHVAFRACQDKASVKANIYGNLMHEARSDMF